MDMLIVISKNPDKTTFKIGDDCPDWTTSGLEVRGLYEDGREEIIENDKLTITGFESKTRGKKAIIVKYGDRSETFFDIVVMEEREIFISAEFVINHTIDKVINRKETYYAMDIIVLNTLTCEQLLIAVKRGLNIRCGKNPDDESSDTVEVVKITDIEKSEPDKKTAIKGKIETKKINSRAKASIVPKYVFTDTLEKSEEIYSEEEIYEICRCIFNKCYSQYHSNYSSIDEHHQGYIGRGNINFHILTDDEKLCESHLPQAWLYEARDRNRTLDELGFLTSSRLVFDISGERSQGSVFDMDINKAFRYELPLYNISDTPIIVLDNSPVNIIPPTEPPQKSRQNMFLLLLSPLLMMTAMLASRFYISTSSGTAMGGMVIMSITMSATSFLMVIFNAINQKKVFESSRAEWRDHYQYYIRKLLKEIKNRQKINVEQLEELYPEKFNLDYMPKEGKRRKTLIDKINCVDGEIFSRTQNHPDFLSVRLGVSERGSRLVPSVFEIIGEKKEAVFNAVWYTNIENEDINPFEICLRKPPKEKPQGYLNNLPVAISKRYAFLEGAPVILKLKNCGSLGVIAPEEEYESFLDNILLELCFYHSPDDLQCILFCKEPDYRNDWQEKDRMIRRYKHLPQFRELLNGLSAFAFSKSDAHLILNQVLEIINRRRNGDKGTKYPHIIVFIMAEDEYDFKKHPISQFLPEEHEEDRKPECYGLGVTFIFFKKYFEKLPRYCEQIIEIKSKNIWRLLPHTRLTEVIIDDEEKQENLSRLYELRPDALRPAADNLDFRDNYNMVFRAFKVLSTLYYHRVAQDIGVPKVVELFHLYYNRTDAKHIYELLSKPDFSVDRLKSQLKELIDNIWSGQVTADITKSLAVPIGSKKEPDGIIELDLHEKKDGPHMLVAGTTGSGKTETILTLLINLCTFYTPEKVNLLLVDMKGGNFSKRIEKLPHVVGVVTDVAGDEKGTGAEYMLKRFLNSMTAEVKKRKLAFNKMGVDSIDAYIEAFDSAGKQKDIRKANLPCLPHLFLVVDEFKELMVFSSENSDIDFKKEISSLARIGRSLGFHLILISQDIESAITPDIDVNAKSRLCLHVATPTASREMIGSDLAARPSMGTGKAYLLVDKGARFEYFQSGYSTATVMRNTERKFLVRLVPSGGEFLTLYDSYDEESNPAAKEAKSKAKQEGTQLEMMINLIGEIAEAHQEVSGRIRQVFSQPLSGHYYFDYDSRKPMKLKVREGE